VDALLKDITELILLDFRNEKFRKNCHREATNFHDEKLLEALRVYSSIDESLSAVLPGVFLLLEKNPENYFQEDNEILSAWSHIMTHVTYLYCNAFFAYKNSEKFPDIYVFGVGLEKVNGVYKLVGQYPGVSVYTNGICMMGKEGKYWCIFIGFVSKDTERNELSFYSVESDDDYPPSAGWEFDIDDVDFEIFKVLSPAPTIISMKWQFM
jgi:hypothetical protein